MKEKPKLIIPKATISNNYNKIIEENDKLKTVVKKEKLTSR